MSFAVSLDDGDLEYSGTDIAGIFAQKSNVLNLRFWSMLRDIMRFYRQAPRDVAKLGLATLGEYLDRNNYGEAFRQDHLYPMAAAVWSLPAKKVADYPAAAFVSFCQNHGLLKIADRPLWRTVDGGARVYVDALCAPFKDRLRLGAPVRSIRREPGGVFIRRGQWRRRAVRPGRHRRPCRSGAGDAERSDAGRAADPRRLSLQPQRGRAA